MWKFLRAVKSLFTARHQATKWADEARLPKSLYGLLIDGKHTGPRSLYLPELEGFCELLSLRVKHQLPGVTVGSKLIEHDVELSAYGKAKEYRHYYWVIKFQGGGLVVTIYAKSKTFDTSKLLSLQEVGPKDIAGTLVNWT